MADEAVIPSGEAWSRVQNVVKRVEGGRAGLPVGETPTQVFPAVVFKVTGALSGGYYPGKLLAWDHDTEAWIETEDCYIKAG